MPHFQNHQVIKCSDVEEGEDVEDPKEEIDIFLEEQMNDDFYPGIKIRCAGILLPSAYEWVSSFSGSSNFFFQATFIEKLDYKFQHARKFFLRQQYILELIGSPNLYDRISNSLFICNDLLFHSALAVSGIFYCSSLYGYSNNNVHAHIVYT